MDVFKKDKKPMWVSVFPFHSPAVQIYFYQIILSYQTIIVNDIYHNFNGKPYRLCLNLKLL